MEVYLIGYTVIDIFGVEAATDERWSPEPFAEDADSLAEFAGRACYQSWSRPRPETATNSGYLARIIENQDFSVMEHASATVYVRGVSRAFSQQMIRHRHFSPSQLSQRYVDEAWRAEPVMPPALRDRPEVALEYSDAWNRLQGAYDAIVNELEADGLTRKQARDAARYILPNGQETRMVVTGNHRAWREFFTKRRSDRASDEIHEFANQAFELMKELAPNCYQDME